MRLSRLIIPGLFVFAPVVAHAATPENFKELVELLLGIINLIIPVLIALAVVWFLWNIAQYIINIENVQTRKSFRESAIYGIIAITLMVSLFSVIQIVKITFFDARTTEQRIYTDRFGDFVL